MERNQTIDILKAIGIILMVAGHSGSPITSWIYMFHMALFFLIAGYCYNEKYSMDIAGLKAFIIKKIRSLYIPCVIFNLSVVLLHNMFYSAHIIGGGDTTL